MMQLVILLFISLEISQKQETESYGTTAFKFKLRRGKKELIPKIKKIYQKHLALIYAKQTNFVEEL